MACVVDPIVSTILQYALAPLGRQFGYLIFHKAHLNSLKSQSEELEVKIATVQRSVNNAKKKREAIRPDVEWWLTEADKSIKKAQTLQGENEANKWCFKWCPNLKSRYSRGKRAKKLAEGMEKLCAEENFPRVSAPGCKPAPPMESTFEKGTKSFESRAAVMENVMQALKDDKIDIIGICGMGGVGKTTMAREVIKRAGELKLFDKIVMVLVSRTPDVSKIQADIASSFDPEWKLNAETTNGRAFELFAKMKEVKRILVFLDDIWTGLKLNEIGIPFKGDHEGCKILLTSRREQAVKDTGAESRIFKVGVLDEEEAWSLFKEKAGISEDSILPANLISTQREVANECKGLPLALVTVGGALRDAGTDVWEHALRQLRQGENIEGVDENLYRSLKYSYEQLGSEEAKKCFLLCSMYPEDYDIPVEDLVRYGFAKKLFKGIGKVGEARVAAYCTVNTLKKCYLLLDSFEGEEHVKMHDVIRDVAISIASKEEDPFMIRYVDEALEDSSEYELQRYDVISLQNLRECELFSNLVFRKLWLFRLKGAGGPLEIPNNFYQGMKNLKVVALSNISIQLLPTSLGDLSNLHTLSMEECKMNGNMSVIGKLENLEILSLKCSKVAELPVEMKKLARLKLLDLCKCEIEMIHRGVLSSLSSLEEIYMVEVRKPLSEHIAELSSLPNVMTLNIRLDDHKLWPRNWTLEKMQSFKIILGVPFREYFPDPERYKLDNKLCLEQIDASAIKGSGLRILLKSSKVLDLMSIGGLKNIFDDLGEDNFECLTSLKLRGCETLEYLVNETHGGAFPVIESLELLNLARLRKICRTQPQKGASNTITSSSSNSKVLFATLKQLQLRCLPELIGNPLWKYEYDSHQQIQEGSAPIRSDCLSNLTYLNLYQCDKLKSVFSAPVARGLMQLKDISISSCKLIEAVVIPSEEEEEIMFPKLEELNFQRLPCFSCFCKVRTTIKMPQLKILKLLDLPNIASTCLPPTTTNINHDPVIQSSFNKVTLPSLEELELCFLDNLMEIWSGELQVPLKLRKLRVEFCPRLLNGDLLPSNWMQCGMSVLENVEVQECQSVEVIFNLQGLRTIKEWGDADPIVAFPVLKYLDLLYLPKLTHVWKINATSLSSFQGFQKLTHIQIRGCSSLRNLFPTCVAKLLQSLKKLKIFECAAMEAIFADVDPIVDDHDNEGTSSAFMVVLLPQLEALNLSYLPNLRSLCPQGFTLPGTWTVFCCPNIVQHC